MLYLHWMGMAAKIQQRNDVVNKQVGKLYRKVKGDGMACCLLKGQSLNQLYGVLKGLIQSGDIDLGIVSPPISVMDWCRTHYKVSCHDYHHVELDANIEQGETFVEIHYRPSMSRNLIRNARL